MQCVAPAGTCYANFTPGAFYIVGGKYYDREGETTVCVERDDRGLDNGWTAEYFEIAGGPW